MKAITLTEWLYFHLWKKDGPDDKNLCPAGVLIPETVFYKCGVPQQWFFTSKSGKILKKGIDHMNLQGIKKCFRKPADPNVPVGLVYDAFPPTLSVTAKKEIDNQLKQNALKVLAGLIYQLIWLALNRRKQAEAQGMPDQQAINNPYQDIDLNDIQQDANEKLRFHEASAGGLLKGWGNTTLGFSILKDEHKPRDPLFISKAYVNEKAMIMANAKKELERLAMRHDNTENNEIYFRLGLKHFTKQQVSNCR